MTDSRFKHIPLGKLEPSPFNPRQNFEGSRFDELVESIRQVGVLEPILVRPKGKKFEIVAGHRRFEASKQAANGSGDKATIPALVREMDDTTAFDVQTIENIHREDLSELEEAKAFKAYIDKHLEGGADRGDVIRELADRTGIRPDYIRRRSMVLDLPEKALQMWADGSLKYGHLEQLLRVRSEEKVLEYLEEMETETWRRWTVGDLHANIDSDSMELTKAQFDTSGCETCQSNSSVQKTLFGMEEDDGVRCLDAECFRRKLTEWLNENWGQSDVQKKGKTNGFRFFQDVNYNEFTGFYGRTPKACKSCQSFVALLREDGTAFYERACVGDRSCYNKMTADPDSNNGSGSTTGKKKDWHGTYFRQRFFQEQLPLRISEKEPQSPEVNSMLLVSLVASNRDIHAPFAVRHMGADPNDEDIQTGWYSIDTADVFRVVEEMTPQEVAEELRTVATEIVGHKSFNKEARRLVAEKLAGIDLQKDFAINEEYLKKKTKPEILEIGESLGVFEMDAATEYLAGTLKRKSFKACKKSELVKVFLESGIDLTGLVPAEILDTVESPNTPL